MPEQLEIFDEVELIRKSIKHNKSLKELSVQRGDFVRLLNKRGTFEKEGQRFTCKVSCGNRRFKQHNSTCMERALRERQLKMFKADKRMREREGISPDRSHRKRSRH